MAKTTTNLTNQRPPQSLEAMVPKIALHLKEVTSVASSSEEIMREKRRHTGSQRINIALSLTSLLLHNNNIVSTLAQCNPCDSNPNGFVVVPFTGCTKFVSCQNGQTTGNEQTCNGGLIFDPNIKGCNWDYMATCPPDPKGCDGSDTEDEEVEAEVGSSSKQDKVECSDLPLCAPGQTGTVVVPYTDCGQYVSCSNGVPGTPNFCSPGQAYSPQIQACNILSQVVCPAPPSCPPSVSPTYTPTITKEPKSPQPTTTEVMAGEPVAPSLPSQSTSSQSGGNETVSIVTPDLLQGVYVIDAHLDANKIMITRELFNGGRPVTSTASTFDYNSFKNSLHTMITTPIDNKSFYIGSGQQTNGRVYGLVNIAAFLSQSVVDSIQHGSCDEINKEVVNGVLPLSNACGQNGFDYQEPSTLCLPDEEKYACNIEWEMRAQAETVGKNPPPFFCSPAKETDGFTGYWDYVLETENRDSPTANTNGKTDVQGCCWWGRGVLQSKGICQYGKLNHFLGKKSADEGRPSLFPDVDFCLEPWSVCTHEKYPDIKWIAGLFRWVMDVQTYRVEDYDYIDQLIRFVDGGFNDWSFIHRVSGIVTQGCHAPPCIQGVEFDGMLRKDMFVKTLQSFGLKINDVSENSRR